jgi:hypothetical protein
MSISFDAVAPDLTSQGICRLIKQLRGDLAAVNASSASTTTKDKLNELTGEIVGELEQGLKFDPDVKSTTWVTGLQALFQQYTAELNPLLSDHYEMAPPQTGACSYRNGCIQTTRAQCTVLGGIFNQGHSCPP